MKKLAALALALLLTLSAALAAELELNAPTGTLHPGQAVLLSFDVPEAGSVTLKLLNAAGSEAAVIADGMKVKAGSNAVYWNGTANGETVAAGDWQLELTFGEERVSAPVTIGEPAPYFLYVTADASEFKPSERLTLQWSASTAAALTIEASGANGRKTILQREVEAGDGFWRWDGSGMEAGEYDLTLQLTAADGTRSTAESISVVLGEDEKVVFTPSHGSPYDGQGDPSSYWNTPMDITDEEAIWAMITAPVTVLKTGKSNDQKRQITLRKEPSEKADGVGVVTCATQSVRVIEQQGDWALIECYSSSFHDSKVKAWNMLVQGWVPAKYLATVKPNTDMGIVIDKLTQRAYIFRDGKLYDTVLVSTGLSNERQPYNETRSGEFLLQVPAVGAFSSDNLVCALGIRFNGGDLLHEVPHLKMKDGGKTYKTTEPKLGTKASHGCIRVQRLRTPLGTNMQWIWEHKKNNMKLIIWEDWQGRQIDIPSDDLVLYYNPKGGTSYHRCETCFSMKKSQQPMTPFTYGELETEPFRKLTWCNYCAPALRRAEIEAINAVYAPGGDHDPIITAAREKALKGK